MSYEEWLHQYRKNEREGQPQLFCIIPAPEGLSWVTVNLRDDTSHPLGDITFDPISQVGYSNMDAFWDRTVPHTREWYPFSMGWVSDSHHSPTGRPKGSTCSCGYRDCWVLGFNQKPSHARKYEDWTDLAAARLAGFQKREAKRAQTREYQRARKERLALEKIQSAS